MADHSKPVLVYIMMGQSNMLGFGRVGPQETKGSLEYFTKEKGRYTHLIDDSGNWITRQDVRYVHVMDPRGVDYNDMETFMAGIRNSKTTSRRWIFATFGEMLKSPPQIRVIITITTPKPTTKPAIASVVPWRICCIEKNDTGIRGRRVHIEKTGWEE